MTAPTANTTAHHVQWLEELAQREIPCKHQTHTFLVCDDCATQVRKWIDDATRRLCKTLWAHCARRRHLHP